MPQDAARYTLVDLTAPGSGGWAYDVNNDRTVVGSAFFCAGRWERAGEQWVEEQITAPPCYPEGGNVFTEVRAVNDSGAILGGNAHWAIPLGMLPVVWHDGTWEYLEIPWGSILDINGSDQAVGHRGPGVTPWGFVWEDGELSWIGQWARAWGINDIGQVVGGLLSESGNVQPAVWEQNDGQWELVKFLPTMPDDRRATATAVNNVGQIVGKSWAAPGPPFLALLWEGDGSIELGTLGGNESIANDINNLGQVVGKSKTTDGVDHAFIWQDGVMCDLNDLIITETDFELASAEAINDLGDIVGWGHIPAGSTHAFFASLHQVGDVNYDSFVGATDLALLLGSWGPCADCANCPADLDNDCTVGPLDLVILLGNWG